MTLGCVGMWRGLTVSCRLGTGVGAAAAAAWLAGGGAGTEAGLGGGACCCNCLLLTSLSFLRSLSIPLLPPFPIDTSGAVGLRLWLFCLFCKFESCVRVGGDSR